MANTPSCHRRCQDLIELVRFNLEKSGFDVLSPQTAALGLAIAAEHAPTSSSSIS